MNNGEHDPSSVDIANLFSMDISDADKQMILERVEQVREAHREHMKVAGCAVRELGRHGWYIDPSWPINSLHELKKAVADENWRNNEIYLMEYLENRIDEIEVSVVQAYPKRETVISAAFRAHREGMYELSIPVLLAQSDGIVWDVTKKGLFGKWDREALGRRLTSETDITGKMLFRLLLDKKFPLWVSQTKRGDKFCGLNRHMVLHGESVDYGTKKNSLRMISFINYVAHLVAPWAAEDAEAADDCNDGADY
jgi:hypothetical protein